MNDSNSNSGGSVARRFAGAFGLAGGLLALLVVVATASLLSSRAAALEVAQVQADRLRSAQDLLSAFYRMELAEDGYLTHVEDRFLRGFKEAGATADTDLTHLEKAGADQEQVKRAQALLGSYRDVFERRQQILSGKVTPDSPSVFQDLTREEEGLLANLSDLLTKLVEEQVTSTQQRIGEMTASISRSLVLVLLAFVVAIGGLLFTFRVGREVAHGLKRLTGSIGAIAESGSLRERVQVRGDDELARLAETFNALIAGQASLEAQAREISSGAPGRELTGKGQLAETFGLMIKNLAASSRSLEALAQSDRTAKSALESSVRLYREFIDDLMKGDLARRLQITGEGDLAVLGSKLNALAERLQEVSRETKSAVELLGQSGTEVLTAATQLASSVAEQAAAVTETNTTIEEVRQIALQSAESAEEVIAFADRSQDVGQSGLRAVERTNEGMKAVHACVQTITQAIITLNERSQQISEITNSVNDLADQSNLLAVNASIEAAKAGEQGKGFAVVAMEVRNMAEQSKQSTRQVRGILGEVQKATSRAVLSAEDGAKKTESGLATTAEAGRTIHDLAKMLDESLQAARKIAASARQQKIGVDQVTMALRNMRQTTTDTSSSAQALERSARSLKELSDRLKRLA